mmetsp:Transcript_97706/g.246485  ORF Transcript_97706/g.246485 Transcript_97706/m.246485 type:complete len:237 (-) Transcript_97706:336-1046(-)
MEEDGVRHVQKLLERRYLLELLASRVITQALSDHPLLQQRGRRQGLHHAHPCPIPVCVQCPQIVPSRVDAPEKDNEALVSSELGVERLQDLLALPAVGVALEAVPLQSVPDKLPVALHTTAATGTAWPPSSLCRTSWPCGGAAARYALSNCRDHRRGRAAGGTGAGTAPKTRGTGAQAGTRDATCLIMATTVTRCRRGPSGWLLGTRGGGRGAGSDTAGSSATGDTVRNASACGVP